jgi:hypothetical protein
MSQTVPKKASGRIITIGSPMVCPYRKTYDQGWSYYCGLRAHTHCWNSKEFQEDCPLDAPESD